MADIKFGTAQISNPTPSKINLWVRVITVVCGVLILWLPSSNIVGPKTTETTMSLLGLLMALINAVAPLFGIEIQSRTVSTEKVTAIDTETKNN